MKVRRLRAGRLRGMWVCAAVPVAALVLTITAAQASAASPVLEFAVPGHGFPTGFTADGGEVTAELSGFDTVVQCTGSHGEGEITGPRSAVSSYVFTGCETVGGTEGGHKCTTSGANEKEIRAEGIEAELVFIDQTRHEVAMLLNPHGGVYMTFECGSEPVRGSGPFLSPVGPINQMAASFTATLSSSGATQIPDEYEGPNGKKLPAIPMGERGILPPVTTGVELGFTILPSASLEIRAVSAAEVEAGQREEEAAAARKKQGEEATARRHQEEEAATRRDREEEAAAKKRAAARKHRQKAASRKRRRMLSKALRRCRKVKSKHRHRRCVNHAKHKYGGHPKNHLR